MEGGGWSRFTPEQRWDVRKYGMRRSGADQRRYGRYGRNRPVHATGKPVASKGDDTFRGAPGSAAEWDKTKAAFDMYDPRTWPDGVKEWATGMANAVYANIESVLAKGGTMSDPIYRQVPSFWDGSEKHITVPGGSGGSGGLTLPPDFKRALMVQWAALYLKGTDYAMEKFAAGMSKFMARFGTAFATAPIRALLNKAVTVAILAKAGWDEGVRQNEEDGGIYHAWRRSTQDQRIGAVRRTDVHAGLVGANLAYNKDESGGATDLSDFGGWSLLATNNPGPGNSFMDIWEMTDAAFVRFTARDENSLDYLSRQSLDWNPDHTPDWSVPQSGTAGYDPETRKKFAGVLADKAGMNSLQNRVFFNEATGQVMVSFRGAGDDRATEWLQGLRSVNRKDFDDGKGGSLGEVGTGFLRSWEVQRGDIQKQLDALSERLAKEGRSITGVVATGHSFGGAMANLLVSDLGHNLHVRGLEGENGGGYKGHVTLTTLAAPMVGTQDFVESVRANTDDIVRVLQRKDKVPKVLGAVNIARDTANVWGGGAPQAGYDYLRGEEQGPDVYFVHAGAPLYVDPEEGTSPEEDNPAFLHPSAGLVGERGVRWQQTHRRPSPYRHDAPFEAAKRAHKRSSLMNSLSLLVSETARGEDGQWAPVTYQRWTPPPKEKESSGMTEEDMEWRLDEHGTVTKVTDDTYTYNDKGEVIGICSTPVVAPTAGGGRKLTAGPDPVCRRIPPASQKGGGQGGGQEVAAETWKWHTHKRRRLHAVVGVTHVDPALIPKTWDPKRPPVLGLASMVFRKEVLDPGGEEEEDEEEGEEEDQEGDRKEEESDEEDRGFSLFD